MPGQGQTATVKIGREPIHRGSDFNDFLAPVTLEFLTEIQALHRGRQRSFRREDDRQTLASEAPVNGEIAAVGGDDFRAAMDLG
jgi:hypothetical protein